MGRQIRKQKKHLDSEPIMTPVASQKKTDEDIQAEEGLRKTLLFVDSAPSLSTLLEDDAFSREYKIDLAFNGLAALKKVLRQAPDALLVDVSDSEVGGYDFIQALQENADTKDIPVIVMGNKDFDDDLKKQIKNEKNVRAFFRKPFIFQELKPRLLKIFNDKRAHHRTNSSLEVIPPKAWEKKIVFEPAEILSADKVAALGLEKEFVPEGFSLSFFQWLLIGLCMIIGAIGGTESYWRMHETELQKNVFDPPLMESQWKNVAVQMPSSSAWKQSNKTYALNKWGLRGEEVELFKPANTYRIVVLGGTDIFGEGVSQNEIITARLQEALQKSKPFKGISRYEVLNGGFWESTPNEQWFRYEQNAAPLLPDMVIWLWGTERSVPYNSEHLKTWSQLPGFGRTLCSYSHVLRHFRQKYWTEDAHQWPSDYRALVKRARSYTEENGGVLVIASPSSIPVNFPTEPQYHELKQKYFFYTTGERPASSNGLWSADDHDSFARVIQKYILLARPDLLRTSN